MPVYAVVGRGKPVFVVSGELKWDTLPLPALFPVCPGTAGRFWPAITQKDKTSSTKPHSAANITTMIHYD